MVEGGDWGRGVAAEGGKDAERRQAKARFYKKIHIISLFYCEKELGTLPFSRGERLELLEWIKLKK